MSNHRDNSNVPAVLAFVGVALLLIVILLVML